jgi:hypothetical protein
MEAGEKPTHDLTLISGDGFTGDIPAGVTISGRFAILPRKDKE